MRFLVDQNLSPLIAAGLREAGHDAVHTIDLGFERAEDTDVLLRAQSEERIVAYWQGTIHRHQLAPEWLLTDARRLQQLHAPSPPVVA